MSSAVVLVYFFQPRQVCNYSMPGAKNTGSAGVQWIQRKSIRAQMANGLSSLLKRRLGVC
jgi:hypothetical protein